MFLLLFKEGSGKVRFSCHPPTPTVDLKSHTVSHAPVCLFAYDASRSVWMIQSAWDCATSYRTSTPFFVDFTLMINTINSDVLHNKLTGLRATCQWITNFLTDRKQLGRKDYWTCPLFRISRVRKQGPKGWSHLFQL